MRVREMEGFTLIELVVVVGLTALLLITVSSLFLTSIVGSGKTTASLYVKQVGQQTLNQMTYILRNARGLSQNQVCQNGMSTLSVLNQDNNSTVYNAISNGEVDQIASNGAVLTPSDVFLSPTAPLSFDCTPSSFGTPSYDGTPPTVTVRFSLKLGSDDSKLRDIVEIPFQGTVTLRNY